MNMVSQRSPLSPARIGGGPSSPVLPQPLLPHVTWLMVLPCLTSFLPRKLSTLTSRGLWFAVQLNVEGAVTSPFHLRKDTLGRAGVHITWGRIQIARPIFLGFKEFWGPP